MARVSVIIVNWNGRHLLEDCLPSVLSQSYDDYEVVILDNGSTDGSVDWVQVHFPSVRLICCDRNLGFAAGNNRAVSETQSDYVALLNNDAAPSPDWLQRLVEVMESSWSIGMCASKMVRMDDPEVMDACGIRIDRAGIGWNRYSGERDRVDETEPYQVLGPCAGAALYRRSMLDQVGLFDEDYFIYYEDVDLAWRAQRRGWRCLYVPQARVVHRHSSTVKEGSSWKGYLLGRNKVWTVVKNYAWPDWLTNLAFILAYDVAAWSYALLHGDVNPLRGRLAALGSLSKALGKRRAIQSIGERVHLDPLANPLHMWRVQREFRKQLARQIG
jgi:GT2 family glycosyltransferase